MRKFIEAMKKECAKKWAKDSVEKGAMTANELISRFEEFKDSNKPVIIEIDGDLYTSIFVADSWRGSYNLPAIDYELDKEGYPLDAVIENLKNLDGTEVTGYNGRNFTLSGDDPIFIAKYGELNNRTAIVDVVETIDYIVCITKQDMY